MRGHVKEPGSLKQAPTHRTPAATVASVCICTRRRPDGLRRLLQSLVRQRAAPPFEVVVVDNDPAASAQAMAESMQADLNLRYVCEPAPGLAAARNRSLQEARGDFLAFIDDDEEADETWLATHHRVLQVTRADVTGGPTRYIFDDQVPQAVRLCRLFNRPVTAEGSALPWYRISTGNAYVRRSALPHPTRPFLNHFGATGGEDVDCFKRMADAGARLVAAGEHATVSEYREFARARYAWVVRRALRNGGNLADLQWRNLPRRDRLRLAGRSLRLFLRDARQARRLARSNQLAFVEKTIDAAEHAGRVLCVAGYRYPEYAQR